MRFIKTIIIIFLMLIHNAKISCKKEYEKIEKFRLMYAESAQVIILNNAYENFLCFINFK